MPTREPDAVVVLRRADLEVARWSLRGNGGPDLAVVDAIARLQLLARRAGWTMVVVCPTPEVQGMLRLVGLPWLLRSPDDSGVESRG